MNARMLSILLSAAVAFSAVGQEIDTELAGLTEKLAKPISAHSKKKIAVVDFTDLQGTSSGELGKYIAEQLTVNFVMSKRDFAILDRANLKSILAEHKLTATGLVDPDNAKKLGQFAGVDALILGTITPRGENINLTAKIITTDTAEIVGAAKATFKSDSTVKELIARPATGGKDSLSDDAAQVTKVFGDLKVELQGLQIVKGNQFELSFSVSNRNPKKSIWVAFNTDSAYRLRGIITDTRGIQFEGDPHSVSGIPAGSQPKSFYGNHDDTKNRFNPSTELKPSESVSGSIKFLPSSNVGVEPGRCKLQLEFLVGHNFTPDTGVGAIYNLVTNLESK